MELVILAALAALISSTLVEITWALLGWGEMSWRTWARNAVLNGILLYGMQVIIAAWPLW